MHGAGLRAVGKLMDRIVAGVHPRSPAALERELRLVAPTCRWTAGEWEALNGLAWDAVENTHRHIRALSNLLVRAYLDAKGAGG
jgi:hypothetical protein